MLHHHRPERGAPLAYTVTDADGVPLIDEATIVSDPRDWVRFLTPWFAATLHTLSFDLPDGSLLCLRLQP